MLLGCICQLVVKQYSSAIYDFESLTMDLADYEDPITYAHSGFINFSLALPWRLSLFLLQVLKTSTC